MASLVNSLVGPQSQAPDKPTAWNVEAPPAHQGLSLWQAILAEPGRIARGVGSALALPGDVYAGRTQVDDPATGMPSAEVIDRAASLAGLLMPQDAALTPETVPDALAGLRRTPPQLPMDAASVAARQQTMGFDPATTYYHGTTAPDFDAFQPSDLGIHFGTAGQANHRLLIKAADTGKPDLAGARIVPAKIAANNPLPMNDVGQWRDPWAVAKALKQAPDFQPMEVNRALLAWTPKGQLANLRGLIQSKGYDSVVYPNQYELDVPPDAANPNAFSVGLPGGSDLVRNSYIVFDPAQVRSPYAEFNPDAAASPYILGAGGVPVGVAGGANNTPAQTGLFGLGQ
jgi:hypothetical protein